jgi:threonine aldolase
LTEGTFPLITNTQSSCAEVLRSYKQQAALEKRFNTTKSILNIGHPSKSAKSSLHFSGKRLSDAAVVYTKSEAHIKGVLLWVVWCGSYSEESEKDLSFS